MRLDNPTTGAEQQITVDDAGVDASSGSVSDGETTASSSKGPTSEPIETIPIAGNEPETPFTELLSALLKPGSVSVMDTPVSRAQNGPHSEPIETIPIGRQ